MRKAISFVCALILTAGLAHADVLEGKVTAVVDGNTLEIKAADSETYKVMLAGVDSPEPGQEFAEEARLFLEKLALKKNVKVELKGKDRWGNQLAVVWLKGEVDVRMELVKEGWAWTAERNPLPELEPLRAEAQEKGIGLWKTSQPTPPWVYRRQQTMMLPKSS